MEFQIHAMKCKPNKRKKIILGKAEEKGRMKKFWFFKDKREPLMLSIVMVDDMREKKHGPAVAVFQHR